MSPYEQWVALLTLMRKEIRRYTRIWSQTLLPSAITMSLYFLIFGSLIGSRIGEMGGVSYMEFVVPGLIMMAIAQNAFANTSSSLMIGKIQGNIVDSLMAPLNEHELVFGFAIGGMTRGIAVAVVVWVAMAFVVGLGVHSLFFIVYHAVMGALMLSLLGVAGGIWSDKFDHIAAVTNFVITPLSFLSGTFYSIQRLPEAAQIAAHFNPFFYMIDGIRYGFIGHADGNLWIGVAVMAVINAGLWWLCTWMFRTGYKLKA